MKSADLHLHSTCSDGKYPPAEVAARCKAAGLALFSLTDHDSMEGVSEALAAAEQLGITCVPGWEVSAYDDVKVHILGYGCERGEAYFAFLEERKKGALVRAEDMIEKGNACLGLSVRLEEALALRVNEDAPLHTMHVVRAFARALGKEGDEMRALSAKLYLELFDRGKPAYSGLARPSPEDALTVIHLSGGIAVLAHPGRIRLSEGEKGALFDRLVKEGLDGIECYYTTHTEEETRAFCAYAAAHGLLQTGGSDFHMEDGVHSVGKPAFAPDERLLLALRSRGVKM